MIFIPVNTWTEFKNIIITPNTVGFQFVEQSDRYELYAASGVLVWNLTLLKDSGDDQTDFETNHKGNANKPLAPVMTTQFEKDDKDLKLARAKADVIAETHKATISLLIPGTYGSGDGRHIAGGWAFSDDYNKDDYATVRIYDTDRKIAMDLALAEDPEAVAPLSDGAVIALGEIPGVGTFPAYPIVKSYTDDDLASENQGWFFWPLAMGNDIPPMGECEVEPIGGYGFLPSGFYLVLEYVRPDDVTTGTVRVDFYWGKIE